MPKIRKSAESFTLIVPRKYRKIAKRNWDSADRFNYGQVIRQAIHDYYVKRGWVDE